jgi:hypothetical protein
MTGFRSGPAAVRETLAVIIMTTATINKIIGGTIVLLVTIVLIPETIGLVSQGGTGLAFLPGILATISFLFTGLLGFISPTTYPKAARYFLLVTLLLLLPTGVLSFFLIPRFRQVLLLLAIVFVALGIRKPAENYLLVVNLCGLDEVLYDVDFYFSNYYR